MFQIVSDSACDFTKEEAQKYDIGVVPFYVVFDQESVLKEGVDITREDYFQRLLSDKKKFPKTSQPNPQDYIDIFTPYLKEGRDILTLTISSKLSGSGQSAKIAAETLKKEYPDRTVKVVDSLSGSVGQGLILREIIKMRDAGYTLEQTVQMAEKVLGTTKLYCTVDSLEYARRGGRIGPATALVGSILGLHPILHMLAGEVLQLDSVRGKKKVLKLIEEAVVDAIKDAKEEISLGVGHILKEAEALSFKASIEEALGIEIIPISEIGVTIGTHAGPGGLIVAYCKKYEALCN